MLTTDQPLKSVYELGGDVAWTQTELAATVSDIIGAPVTVANVAPTEQRAILVDAGVPEVWADFAVDTDSSIKNGELEVSDGDLSTHDRPAHDAARRRAARRDVTMSSATASVAAWSNDSA